MKRIALISLCFVISLLHANSNQLQMQEFNQIINQTQMNIVFGDLEDFSSRFPDSEYGQKALLELGKIKLLERDYDGSLKYLKKIHHSKVNDKQYWMSKNYLYLLDYENAIVAAQNYIYDSKEFTKIELSYLLISESYMQKGLYSKALNTLENLRQSQYIINQIPLMLYKMGICKEALKEYQQAANTFKKLKQDYPYSQFSYQAEEHLLDLLSAGKASKPESLHTNITPDPVVTGNTAKGMKDFLQAGAFSSTGNAEKLGEKIKEIGYDYQIYSKVKNGSKLFVVAVGPFDQKALLDTAKGKLKDKGINTYPIKRF